MMAGEGASIVVNDLGGNADGTGTGRIADDVVAEIQAAGGKAVSNTNSVAEVSGGFRLLDAEVLVLTGAELFHRSPVRRGRSRARGKPISSLMQLDLGDLVVHLSHGIGLYRGLKHIEK